VGANITDVGGPAVSNQWIINKTFIELLNNSYDYAIVQLTSPGKLDVEVDADRELALVKTDSLRNFTYQGVWPSSHSREHPAKAMYEDLLYSPGLEIEELFVKVMMLHNWCHTHNVKLIVIQAYDLPWTDQHRNYLKDIVQNLDQPLYKQYQQSEFYQCHDSSNQNTVPCIGYQADLAYKLAGIIAPTLLDRIQKIKDHLDRK
jgi:hypothetical protein